jgi:hypothetical protein
LEISSKKLVPCSLDSKTNLLPVLNYSKKTKSKPPSIPLSIKSNPLKKLLPSTTMLKEELLISKNVKLTSKSNLLLKNKLGNYPDNLTKPLLMLKKTSPPKKLSTNKKLTDVILNSLILIGLLTSSWNKLLPSVPLSEKELMTTFMMKDLMTCSPENPMNTTISDLTVSDQID